MYLEGGGKVAFLSGRGVSGALSVGDDGVLEDSMDGKDIGDGERFNVRGLGDLSVAVMFSPTAGNDGVETVDGTVEEMVLGV